MEHQKRFERQIIGTVLGILHFSREPTPKILNVEELSVDHIRTAVHIVPVYDLTIFKNGLSLIVTAVQCNMVLSKKPHSYHCGTVKPLICLCVCM